MAAPTPQPAQSPEHLRHGLAEAPVTYARMVWRRFRRNRLALVGLGILLLLGLLSVLAPYISPFPRDKTDLKVILAAPSMVHWLGTDELGRDLFTRLLWGGRVSYTLAISCVAIYIALGGLLGAIAGYFGGWVDSVLMRLVDVVYSFPFLLLALTLVAIFGPNVTNLVFAFVVIYWTTPARLIRGEFLSLRERDYVEAARATGASSWRIMLHHLLPNALAPLIVQATLDLSVIILAEASLSYLGFGVRDPVPTWGNMLTSAQSVTVLAKQPWRWIPPGSMIFLSVLAINFVGDGLRDATDPRLKQ